MDVLWVILIILILGVIPAVLVGVGIHMGFSLGDSNASIFVFSCLSIVTLIFAYAALLFIVCVAIVFSTGNAYTS